MVTLWERMGEIYGALWERQFGDVNEAPIRTWARGLAEYSEKQIGRGVEMCGKADREFPPNLGQFSKLCLSSPAAHDPITPPERQIANPRTPEVRKRELERQAAVKAAPKDREADNGVETFEESYRNIYGAEPPVRRSR